MPKKYRLLERQPMMPDVINDYNANGYTFVPYIHRIQALVDIPLHGVKAGDLGGYVEDASCLSHEGSCWIAGTAIVGRVDGKAGLLGKRYRAIQGDALVGDGAVILNSIVTQSATVSNGLVYCSIVSGRVSIAGKSTVILSEIKDQAKISGTAAVNKSLINSNADISGNARVIESYVGHYVKVLGDARIDRSNLVHEVVVEENANVYGSFVCSRAQVAGRASVTNSYISGDAIVMDDAVLSEGCGVGGRTVIHGKAVLGAYTLVSDKNISEPYSSSTPTKTLPMTIPEANLSLDVSPDTPPIRNVFYHAPTRELRNELLDAQVKKQPGELMLKLAKQLPAKKSPATIAAGLISSTQIKGPLPTKPPTLEKSSGPTSSTELDGLRSIVEEVESSYSAYTEDIVKLIKYPLMADQSVPEVEDFVLALKNAKRLLLGSDVSKISVAVEALERAFIRAENRVRTDGLSTLDEAKRKSIETAGRMLAIAMNGGATKDEKSVSFKAGLRQLEGVVAIPEEAIDRFKAKAGLLAIEA